MSAGPHWAHVSPAEVPAREGRGIRQPGLGWEGLGFTQEASELPLAERGHCWVWGHRGRLSWQVVPMEMEACFVSCPLLPCM